MNNSASDVDKALKTLTNMSEKIDTIIDDTQTYLSLADVDMNVDDDVCTINKILFHQDLNWTKYILPSGKSYYCKDNEVCYEIPDHLDENLVNVECIFYVFIEQ